MRHDGDTYWCPHCEEMQEQLCENNSHGSVTHWSYTDLCTVCDTELMEYEPCNECGEPIEDCVCGCPDDKVTSNGG